MKESQSLSVTDPLRSVYTSKFVTVRVHVPSPCPSPSPSKFIIVPRVTDRLTDGLCLEPILFLNVILMVTMTTTGTQTVRISGTFSRSLVAAEQGQNVIAGKCLRNICVLRGLINLVWRGMAVVVNGGD